MSDSRKNILIATYVFPPFAAVSVYRILDFCKFLPDHNVHVSVLTPRQPNTMSVDEKLLEQVPEGTEVYHTALIEPFRVRRKTLIKQTTAAGSNKEKEPESGNPPPSLISRLKKYIRQLLQIPDGASFWALSGLSRGLKAVRREKIDIIFSSGPPQSVHVLAALISKITGKAHVLDFRDLWTQNTSYHERELPPLVRKLDRRLERHILKRSAGITVNTATFKKQLLENNVFLKPEKIAVIANGIDPEKFRALASGKKQHDYFKMVYTGSLYGRHRDPEFFLKAVNHWVEDKSLTPDQVKVKFIGNWMPEYKTLLKQYCLNDYIEIVSWIPQRQVLADILDADLLLLFQGFDPVLTAAIPRKLFEYIYSGGDILAFAPPGEIPDMIDKYKCGTSISNPDIDAVVQSLDERYRKWTEAVNTDDYGKIRLRELPELKASFQANKLAEFCREISNTR